MECLRSIDDSILMNAAGASAGCGERSGRSEADRPLFTHVSREQPPSVTLLAQVSLLLICLIQPLAAQAGYRVGPLDWDRSGAVSIVVDLPENTTGRVSEFELIEDGTVTVKARDMRPFGKSKQWKLALALCVDTSGSMVAKIARGAPRGSPANDPLTETRNALDKILSKGWLRSSDLVSVSSFASSINLGRWYAPPGQGLRDAVAALKYPEGEEDTVLYDALSEALGDLSHVRRAERLRRRVLVISDGHNEKGEIRKISVVRDYATQLLIPIDVVARVRTDRADYVRSKGYTEELRGLASQTGGRFELAGPGQVYDALSRILTAIMNTPVLHFERTIEKGGQKTSSVGVYWQSPQEGGLRDSIPAAIPMSQLVGLAAAEPVKPAQPTVPETKKKELPPTPKPPPLPSVWAVALVGVVVVLFVLAWFWLRQRGRTPPTDEPRVEPILAVEQTGSAGKAGRETEPGGRVTQIRSHFSPPRPGQPTAVLVGVGGAVLDRAYRVEKDEFYIGAAADNDLPIPDDEYVSSQHAVLRFEQGSLLLLDQGSKNKTYLNGFELGSSGAEVGFGDRIQLGASVLEVTAPV